MISYIYVSILSVIPGLHSVYRIHKLLWKLEATMRCTYLLSDIITLVNFITKMLILIIIILHLVVYLFLLVLFAIFQFHDSNWVMAMIWRSMYYTKPSSRLILGLIYSYKIVRLGQVILPLWALISLSLMLEIDCMNSP